MPSGLWGGYGSGESDVEEDVDESGSQVLPVGFGQVWEGYSRALGGGLIEPQTGSNSLVDTDGEFYEGEYDGPTNVYDTTLEGVEVATVEAMDAAADAADPFIPDWFEWILNHQEEVVAVVVLFAFAYATQGTVGSPGGGSA